MPILKNAKKALRASNRKAVVNAVVRATMRTAVRKMQLNPSVELMNSAYSSIDKAVKSNLVHRNKAARMKSALSKLIAVQ